MLPVRFKRILAQILLIIDVVIIGLIAMFSLILGIVTLSDLNFIGILGLGAAFVFWIILKFLSDLINSTELQKIKDNYRLGWATLIFGALIGVFGALSVYIGWSINRGYFPETTSIANLYQEVGIAAIIGTVISAPGLFLLLKGRRYD